MIKYFAFLAVFFCFSCTNNGDHSIKNVQLHELLFEYNELSRSLDCTDTMLLHTVLYQDSLSIISLSQFLDNMHSYIDLRSRQLRLIGENDLSKISSDTICIRLYYFPPRDSIIYIYSIYNIIENIFMKSDEIFMTSYALSENSIDDIQIINSSKHQVVKASDFYVLENLCLYNNIHNMKSNLCQEVERSYVNYVFEIANLNAGPSNLCNRYINLEWFDQRPNALDTIAQFIINLSDLKMPG